MEKNTKSFNVSNKISQTFSIIIANFQYAATLFFRINDHIRITFVSSAIMKLVSVLSAGKNRITYVAKIIIHPVWTLNAKRISIIANLKQRMSAVTIIYLRYPMIFVSKARQKIVSIINQGKLTITATPLLVTLLTLGHFDPDSLLTLDSQTLADMDYTLV